MNANPIARSAINSLRSHYAKVAREALDALTDQQYAIAEDIAKRDHRMSLTDLIEKYPQDILSLAGKAANLTPDSVEVGIGVTKHLWSDSKAYTIVEVKRNGKQIVIQRDKATRTNKANDQFFSGGFVGHTVDAPEGQQWAYECDEDGITYVANWSAKKQRFFVGGPSGNQVTKGRHEHYDYNF